MRREFTDQFSNERANGIDAVTIMSPSELASSAFDEIRKRQIAGVEQYNKPWCDRRDYKVGDTITFKPQEFRYS